MKNWKFLSVLSYNRALDSSLILLIAYETSESILPSRVEISIVMARVAASIFFNDLSMRMVKPANLSSTELEIVESYSP